MCRAAVTALLAVFFAAGTSLGQSIPEPTGAPGADDARGQDATSDQPSGQSPIVTIRQQELFEQSDFGKASLARIADGMAKLQVENRKIEADLEAEERDLTTRRTTTPPVEFRGLAEAFDKKVEGIRAAQDAKSAAMSRERDTDQKRFFELSFPILAELMRGMGAVALIDQSTVVLSLNRIDVTDVAITRLNAALKGDEPGTDSAGSTGPEIRDAIAPDASVPAPAMVPDIGAPAPPETDKVTP